MSGCVKQAWGTLGLVAQFGSFLKLGVPSWGVPIIRAIVFRGLYWDPLTLGNYHLLAVGSVVHVFGSLARGTEEKFLNWLSDYHSEAIITGVAALL